MVVPISCFFAPKQSIVLLTFSCSLDCYMPSCQGRFDVDVFLHELSQTAKLAKLSWYATCVECCFICLESSLESRFRTLAFNWLHTAPESRMVRPVAHGLAVAGAASD